MINSVGAGIVCTIAFTLFVVLFKEKGAERFHRGMLENSG